MSSNVLAPKDVNAAIVEQPAVVAGAKPDVKSMDYHRQILAGKMAEQYVYPSLGFSRRFSQDCDAQSLTSRAAQKDKLHIPIRRYHVSMHGKIECLSQ